MVWKLIVALALVTAITVILVDGTNSFLRVYANANGIEVLADGSIGFDPIR